MTESVAAHMSDEHQYQRRVRAWTMYDWANSAFATTILAAILPIYFSQVAGATLPSEAAATAMWSLGLSISLFIVAIFSPILGTVSDVIRGKKRFLAIFVGFGTVATGLLILVSTGDWLLASILFIVGRIGFTGANVFYDALLPHVAKEADQDSVSTRGYAMGYLGGGILLAINVVMLQVVPDFFEHAALRLSLFSVAIWWAVFSLPLFLRIPEPPAPEKKLDKGETILSVSLSRLRDTLQDVQRYRELFKLLIAFLIYNDGIGTIIGVAAIYGAELGFDTFEMILALLLVQFVGIPFSIIFGRIPSKDTKYRPQFLAFVIFSVIVLPLVGIIGVYTFPADLTGAQSAPYADSGTYYGEGIYTASDSEVSYTGNWDEEIISAGDLSGGRFFEFVNTLFGERTVDMPYFMTNEAGSSYELAFNGQEAEITYSIGPDHGSWAIMLDDAPYLDDDGEAFIIDAQSDTIRYNITEAFLAESPGEHVLTFTNQIDGKDMTLAEIEVLPPARKSQLITILGIIVGVQAAGAIFAALAGKALFSGMAEKLDTKRSIILALVVYAVIAVWGFIINSTIEFWFLAWMVAIVQGGSQALSRSLYASMSPAAKSGEFFGLFGVMEKFSAILGPLLFAAAVAVFGSSRPAILSLIAFFIIGIILLRRVDVDEGRRVAQEEDAQLLAS